MSRLHGYVSRQVRARVFFMQQGIFDGAAFSFWRSRLAERSKNLQDEKPKCGSISAQRRSQLFWRVR